jgi:putative membrane protein
MLMIILLLIAALLIAIVAVIFAIQNPGIVTVTFVAWKFTTSLTLLLLIALAVGALVMFFIMLPGAIRLRYQIASHKRTIKDLQKAQPAQVEAPVVQRKVTPETKPLDPTKPLPQIKPLPPDAPPPETPDAPDAEPKP